MKRQTAYKVVTVITEEVVEEVVEERANLAIQVTMVAIAISQL